MPDSSNHDAPRPEWWIENERLTQELDIPPYTPPRFKDDVYTHTIVSPLEEEHDCTIRFISPNADGWYVYVDGERVVSIDRRRDKNGNTVYGTDSDEFEKVIEEHLS